MFSRLSEDIVFDTKHIGALHLKKNIIGQQKAGSRVMVVLDLQILRLFGSK